MIKGENRKMNDKWNETCEACDRIKESPSATHCDNCSDRIDTWVQHFQELEGVI